MESKEAKRPQEPTDVPSAMREWMERMERMCGSAGFDPIDMCRRRMASMGRTPEAEGAAPEGADAQGKQDGDEAGHGCCGPP